MRHVPSLHPMSTLLLEYLDWNERPLARKFNLPTVEAKVYGPLVVSVVLG